MICSLQCSRWTMASVLEPLWDAICSLETGFDLRASSCRGLSRGTKIFSCMSKRRARHCCSSPALPFRKPCISLTPVCHTCLLGCKSWALAPSYAGGAVTHLGGIVPRAHEHDVQTAVVSVVERADRHKVLPAPSKRSHDQPCCACRSDMLLMTLLRWDSLEQQRHPTCRLARPAGPAYLRGSRWPRSRSSSVSAPPPDPMRTAHKKHIAADKLPF
jgi:hypothetical protein